MEKIPPISSSCVLLTLFYAFTFIKKRWEGVGGESKMVERVKVRMVEGGDRSLIYEVRGRVKIRHFIRG